MSSGVVKVMCGSVALGLVLTACTKESFKRAGSEWIRSACSDTNQCSYVCPDGTETDADFPRCKDARVEP